VGIIMKTFADYLIESKKTYAFTVKVAGDLAEGFNEKLKTALERYSVANISKGKRAPITENPADFPQLKNVNVTAFNVEVRYPTTSAILEQYICQCCGCKEGSVVVRAANESAVSAQEEDNFKEAENKPLIGQCDPPPSNHQDIVGEKRISNFLKDLANAKHGGEQYKGVNDQLLAKSAPSEKAPATVESGASISPIGSKTLKGKK